MSAGGGRFQDADESAYYEFICRETGIAVHYCAEQFENDGSLSATIIKNMKRAMAGEYSRELSTKVFAGQCRLITLGFRQGGPAGFGLRRQLVDELCRPKGELARGLYRLFVLQRRLESEIAALLKAEGVMIDLGRSWTRSTVHQVLTNEKYIGNNVYNRRSFKLKAKRVLNTPDMWVRKDGAFDGIVEPDFFEAAQRIIQDRSRRFSDEELLGQLSALLEQKGWLSGLVIDEVEDMASSSPFRHRFGSRVRAYALVGYEPAKDFRYIETNRALRRLHPDIVAQVIAEVAQAGGTAERDDATDLITVNAEFTAHRARSLLRNRRRSAAMENPPGSRAPTGYHHRCSDGGRECGNPRLLPSAWIEGGADPSLKLSPENGVRLDAFRFDDLDGFYDLTRRTELRAA